eukprot:43555-Amphidinium_carterae.1
MSSAFVKVQQANALCYMVWGKSSPYGLVLAMLGVHVSIAWMTRTISEKEKSADVDNGDTQTRPLGEATDTNEQLV